MGISKTHFFLFLALLLPALASAQAEYAFPIQDPYYSTITAGLLKADDRDADSIYHEIKLQPLPERNAVPYYRPTQNRVVLRFWPARHKIAAPLIFMVAGLGGAANNSYLNYLGNLFQKNGYHVITVPSPMHWSFALAASTSGMPGISKRDAPELYRLMALALDDIKAHDFIATSTGLMGISLGALNAAYVNEIDKKEKKIGFKRVLLINPPMDNLFAMQRLDELKRERTNLSEVEVKTLFKKVRTYGASLLLFRDVNDPSYFNGIESKFSTTLTERRFLIGSSMREFLGSLIFTTQQIRDLGIFKNPVATTDAGPRLIEAGDFNFFDYLNLFLIKSMQAQDPSYNLESLKSDTYLFSIENGLRSDKNIFVMHNEDDPIVNSEQILQLRDVFGDRATIYPLGGHIGNLWFPENREKILSTFSVLK